MVGRRRTPTDAKPTDAKPPDLGRRPGQADLNEIVAYNFRAARELRGWTQDDTARALEGLLGQRLPQASISAIERAYEGDRHREFDAHEILAFALAFDLPLLWFFSPRPATTAICITPRTSSASSTASSSGAKTSSIPSTTGSENSASTSRPKSTGPSRPHRQPSRARQTSYRERRKQLLLALLDQYTDDVDRAAEEIGTFFDHLRQVGVRGLVTERLNDPDYQYPPESASKPAKQQRH